MKTAHRCAGISLNRLQNVVVFNGAVGPDFEMVRRSDGRRQFGHERDHFQ